MPRSGALPETCTVIPVLASSAPTSLAMSGDEAMVQDLLERDKRKQSRPTLNSRTNSTVLDVTCWVVPSALLFTSSTH
eukprot:4990333-Pyramimonas_sp.AAC.1